MDLGVINLYSSSKNIQKKKMFPGLQIKKKQKKTFEGSWVSE